MARICGLPSCPSACPLYVGDHPFSPYTVEQIAWLRSTGGVAMVPLRERYAGRPFTIFELQTSLLSLCGIASYTPIQMHRRSPSSSSYPCTSTEHEAARLMAPSFIFIFASCCLSYSSQFSPRCTHLYRDRWRIRQPALVIRPPPCPFDPVRGQARAHHAYGPCPTVLPTSMSDLTLVMNHFPMLPS